MILAGCNTMFDTNLPNDPSLNYGPQPDYSNPPDFRPDMTSCRSFCTAQYSAPYFTWVGPAYWNARWRGGCFCKDSNSSAKAETGMVSGEAACGGESSVFCIF